MPRQPPLDIGPLDPSETDALGVIFFDAVHDGTAAFYSPEQQWAWAPVVPSGAAWASRLLSQHALVARDDGLPVGFMTLDKDGYIDLAFVAPAQQRKGIGTRLYSAVEGMARDAAIGRLHSQASFLVKGLFERHGWSTVREQQVDRSNTTLTNFLMEKHLARP